MKKEIKKVIKTIQEECKYQENETTDSLYTLLNKKDKLLKELKQIVVEDVPHQYQERLLDLLNK